MSFFSSCVKCQGVLESTYSMPMDRRDTLTTRRSRMLKEFRQKEPLWRIAPYVVIWGNTKDTSDSRADFLLLLRRNVKHYLEYNLCSEHRGEDDVSVGQNLRSLNVVHVIQRRSFGNNRTDTGSDVTLFLKDIGSMGSSAARETEESRMKSRMMLVKVVALMIRWHSLRNLTCWTRKRLVISSPLISVNIVMIIIIIIIKYFYSFPGFDSQRNHILIVCLNSLISWSSIYLYIKIKNEAAVTPTAWLSLINKVSRSFSTFPGHRLLPQM